MLILTYQVGTLESIDFPDSDTIRVNFISGLLLNLRNNKTVQLNEFYDAQLKICQNGGLLG
ncbi:MAG: hypothetical protein ACOYOV_07780 [Bacteroidales bacterium]